GGERLDLAAGIVAATIANVHRGKNVEAFKPADFMPLMPKRESADGGLAQFIAWAKGHNARLKEASDG
ncbi:MAG: hypothetical protein N2444_07485, partial [Methylocystis sp.]|nr:hypothetical protein [Methylocystis sp.]